MTHARDRSFDWIAALAVIAGVAVMIPSLAALVVNLLAVLGAVR